ncbi:hypothetical protein C8R41DRAFT_905589 [Lentinula lateritia]|uniref:Uncharacterized protein n=1 Tax=Lentinula lateritia TaxID=40482 RepID=A0ABQ8V2M2_9AGAR|nr:hypothetical protein C8R41DRAFT_905589 [Lentinula lateritia]
MDQEQPDEIYPRRLRTHTQTGERRRKRARERILKMGNMRVHCKCGCVKYPDSSCRPLGGMILVTCKNRRSSQIVSRLIVAMEDRSKPSMVNKPQHPKLVVAQIVKEVEKGGNDQAADSPKPEHLGTSLFVKRTVDGEAWNEPIAQNARLPNPRPKILPSVAHSISLTLIRRREHLGALLAPRVSIYHKQGFGFLIISSRALQRASNEVTTRQRNWKSLDSEIQVTHNSDRRPRRSKNSDVMNPSPKWPRIKDEQEEVEVLSHILDWKVELEKTTSTDDFSGDDLFGDDDLPGDGDLLARAW